MSNIMCKKGQVITFEEGRYSESYNIMYAVAIEDVTQDDIVNAMKHYDSDEAYAYEIVIEDLIKQGKLIEIDVAEINLDYFQEIYKLN